MMIISQTNTESNGDDLQIDPASILEALPNPLITVNRENKIIFLNSAAELFFDGSLLLLKWQFLSDLLSEDTPLFNMVKLSRQTGSSISDYDLTIESPRVGTKVVNIGVSLIPDSGDCVCISLFERSIAQRLQYQQQFRGAARSVSGMAAMLAHEVKNPLSGIRGAAQLLSQTIEEDDQSLTQLICDETDRICSLVDKMEEFSDERPIRKESINIHEVLDHCRQLASAGFGKHVRFQEEYDPSLPHTLGDRFILIQLFLNLLKNACEAVPKTGGEIKILTAYRHGMRIKVAGSTERLHLPLVVAIKDNGNGISDDLLENIFEPFVTSKASGTGLGLAFVAKAVSDHGGVMEVDSQPKNTTFQITLPVVDTTISPIESAGSFEDQAPDKVLI
jgi:two-component system nitrogen regulation sensor histidine kinase GlnL